MVEDPDDMAAATATERARASLANLRSSNKRRQALVAEDDDPLRDLVVGLLLIDGWEVVEVANGAEMFAILGAPSAATPAPASPFDLIITDVRMPGATGLDVVSRLRDAGCATPVIVMTAYPDEAVRRLVAELGAMLLPKPFTLADLSLAARGKRRADRALGAAR